MEAKNDKNISPRPSPLTPPSPQIERLRMLVLLDSTHPAHIGM